MKYSGQFKDINNNTIQVDIITGGVNNPVVELTFAGETPVIINQTSNDGIFTPIKSRGCTITVVTTDEYWNMYSASSHGTKVTVTNVTRSNEVLFNGYLTPCEYNQPLVYLNEIELEAVDTVSTLHDYKYTYINGSSSQLASIENIIKHILVDIAGITGGIYVPKLGLQMRAAWSAGCYPTEMEFLSEEVFLNTGTNVSDNDDEAMTCYEVLEEICKFYNFTLVPYGNDVYFIDYEDVAKFNINCAEYTQETNYLKYKNLRNDFVKSAYIPKHITINDYAGDDQNIEIDNVYNKVQVKVETEDVEDEDIQTDIMDDLHSSAFYMYATGQHRKSDDNLYTYISRIFEFNGIPDSRWRTKSNTNAYFTTGGYVFQDNFTQIYNSQTEAKLSFPYVNNTHLFNQIVGQTCLPAQQFSFNPTKSVPYYPNWNNYLFFFPQTCWLNEYYKRNTVSYESWMYSETYWNGLYESHLGGTYAVLRFDGDKDIEYSPTTSDKINYLCFTGDLLWQRNGNIGGTNYDFWNVDEENHKYSGSLATVQDLGGQVSDASTRDNTDSHYREGWNMLKVTIKIGNKYWNGSSWTTTASTCWIPYHESDVETEDECLVWGGWNKPVCNHYYNSMVNKDAYIIPITNTDGLHGKLHFDIYMPKIPWTGGVVEEENGYARIDYKLTPPVIFMKDLSLSLVSAPSDTQHWYNWMEDIDAKKTDDDEINYSNTINTNNVKDFDDLSLKINTYNSKKPISKSYIIQPTDYTGSASSISSVNKCVYHTQGFYRPHTDETIRQEMNIVNRYVEHHTNPKRIYNCTIHGYYEPFRCLDSSTALDTGKFIIDEQEYDVKNDINTMKLIEY